MSVKTHSLMTRTLRQRLLTFMKGTAMKTRGMGILLMKSGQCQVRDQGRSQGPIQVNVQGQCQIWDQNLDPVRYLEAVCLTNCIITLEMNSCVGQLLRYY